jgi:hypothetical protein
MLAFVKVGFPVVQAGATTESALITKSVVSNAVKDIYILFYYYLESLIFTGTVILAPESLPITVRVVVMYVADPKRDLTVVAVIFRDVPITVLDTLVPIVVFVLLRLVASAVFIPTPVKRDIVLTSPIIKRYPEVSVGVAEPT